MPPLTSSGGWQENEDVDHPNESTKAVVFSVEPDQSEFMNLSPGALAQIEEACLDGDVFPDNLLDNVYGRFFGIAHNNVGRGVSLRNSHSRARGVRSFPWLLQFFLS